MRRRNIILLSIVCLVAGLLAVWSTSRYISAEKASHEASINAKYTPIELVVANRDLKPGDVISPSTVSVRSFPASYIRSDAIRKENYNTVKGYALTYPVRSGEPILAFNVSQKKGGKFASLILNGRRSVTVDVNHLSSSEGMLAPNDYVDLFLSTNYKKQRVTSPLLGNIRVLAVGTQTTQVVNDGSQLSGYSTVTFDVSPEEAVKILHAKKIGKILMVLRGAGESGDIYDKTIFNKDVYHRDLLVKNKKRFRKNDIEIIIGGQE